MRTRPPPEYVYLISFGEDQKIGISWNAERRLLAYGSSGRVINIWHRPKHAAEIEREIKWRMKRLRSHGLECFKVPLDVMVEFTESVVAWFDDPDKGFDRMTAARQQLIPYMNPPKKKRKKHKILPKRQAT